MLLILAFARVVCSSVVQMYSHTVTLSIDEDEEYEQSGLYRNNQVYTGTIRVTKEMRNLNNQVYTGTIRFI